MSENYSTYRDRIDDLVASIADAFTVRQLTLSTAESITGGLVGASIVSRPGSSTFFKGGITAYGNESKEKLLGVRHRTLTSHGAVSRETAIEMAHGAQRAFLSSVSVSCTGIAGPTGQTTGKPVGLVFIAVAGDSRVNTEEQRFEGSREEIRWKATERCLSMVLEFVTSG